MDNSIGIGETQTESSCTQTLSVFRWNIYSPLIPARDRTVSVSVSVFCYRTMYSQAT